MRRFVSVLIGPVGLMAVTGLIAACATSRADSRQTQPSSPSPDAVTSAGRLGTLTGLVTITGGPITANGRMALNNRPEAGQSVAVTSPRHPTITAITDAAGRFTISLPTGDYTVAANCGTETVTISDGPATSITLACQVP